MTYLRAFVALVGVALLVPAVAADNDTRATRHGRLVNDVGGPDVLAPASGPVILRGRVVGRVTLSIQDDAGYIKLLHRFTGATVALTGTGLRLTLPRFPTGTLDVFARGPTPQLMFCAPGVPCPRVCGQ